MPLKEDKIKLDNAMLDRRCKLLPCQKERMRYVYERSGYSYAQLAKKYGVSKRTIMFCCNPESLEKVKQQFAQRRKDGRYYKKESHRLSTASLRQYKKDLNLT